MWGKVLQVVLKYLGLPLAQWLLNKLIGWIGTLVQKYKDNKNVKDGIKEGKKKLEKINAAKKDKNETDYNNNIDDV